nr:DUF4232 domain-containing protein [Rhodococcus sp. (in: high G+C Gram-positive bacteria)]
MYRRAIVVAVSVACVLGAVAGCASDDTTVAAPATETVVSAAPPISSSAVTSAAAEVTATPSTSAAVGGANCLAAELSVTLGTSNGAAGSTELPIVFANVGNRTCTVDGYPGVSYLTSPGGTQVGLAATRVGSGSPPVELAPGNSATSLVKATVVANYPADQCQPTPVEGLNVYSPNTTEAVYLPYATTGCATTDASITQLAVQPVVAG